MKGHKDMYAKGMSVLLKKIYKLGVKKKEESPEMDALESEEPDDDEDDEVGSAPERVSGMAEDNVRERVPQFPADDEKVKKKKQQGMMVVSLKRRQSGKMKG